MIKNYDEQTKIVDDYIASHYKKEVEKLTSTMKSINSIQDQIGELMGQAEKLVCESGLTFYFEYSPLSQHFQSDDDEAKAKNQELIERIKAEILEAKIIEDFEYEDTDWMGRVSIRAEKASDVIEACVSSVFEEMNADCEYDGWQHSSVC
jgi:hypothetical protein